MSTVILIPARAGSKGVKNKNLVRIQGIPLVLRSLVHAEYLAHKDMQICISSDSFEILINCAKYLKIKLKKRNFSESIYLHYKKYIFHLRPNKLAQDESLIIDLIKCLQIKINEIGFDVSNWLLLQPTSPFRSRNELATVRKILLENANNQDISLVSVKDVNEIHPARMYTRQGSGNLYPLKQFKRYYFSRRQDLPNILIRDGGFYVIGSSLVLRSRQYSQNPVPLIREHPWNINIDSLNDLFLARGVLKSQLSKDPNTKGS